LGSGAMHDILAAMTCRGERSLASLSVARVSTLIRGTSQAGSCSSNIPLSKDDFYCALKKMVSYKGISSGASRVKRFYLVISRLAHRYTCPHFRGRVSEIVRRGRQTSSAFTSIQSIKHQSVTYLRPVGRKSRPLFEGGVCLHRWRVR
jgi:hypothetical protein